MFHRMGEEAGRADATPAQVGLLHMLIEAGEPLTPREIAKRLEVTPATITGALNRLEESGHVERARESKDRRVVHVRVTPKGRALAKRWREAWWGHFDEVFGPLSDEELRTLVDLLTRVAPPIRGPPGGFGALLRRDAAGKR